MRWILESSLRLAAVVLVAAGVIMFVGVMALRHAAVDTLPEFLPPQVQVQTEALGLSTNEVEQFITVPLEDEFNGLPFLDHLRSQSVPGLSSIELTFKPGTDIYKARQLVTERVAQGPSVVNVGTPPVIVQPLSSESRAMMIGLSSRQLSLIDLSTLARWRVRPRLLAVPGVANVTIWGQRDKQLQVLVDPARMRKQGVSLDQVISTTGDAMWTSPLTFVEASSPGADGFIDMPNQRISVQHILPIKTAADLAKVPIEETKKPLPLSSVATVVEDHPALRGDALLKQGEPGFILVVEKFPGANTLAVTRGVEAAMDELKPGLAGVTVDMTIFQPATYIETALRTVGLAALAGFVLLALWLAVASRSWRVPLIGIVAFAFCIIATAGVLYVRDTTFNTMTLVGVVTALGVIIDDAVVGTIAMQRRLAERGEDGEECSVTSALVETCMEMRRPLVYALAILLLATLPLLVRGGFSGPFTGPVVVSYALALLVSTAVALVVIPVLGYLLLPSAAPHSPEKRARRLAGRIERGFGLALRGFVGRSAWVYGAVGLLVVVGAAMLPQLGRGPVIPAFQDRDLLVQWQAQAGTSLPEMERITGRASGALRALSGVRDVNTELGQALMGDQVVDVDSAQTWISLDPKADYSSTVAAIRHTLDGFVGLGHTLETYAATSLEAARTNTGKAITVRLYGTNQQTLYLEAQQIRQRLTDLHGIVDAQVSSQVERPAIQIQANVAAAARFGLKPGDIRRQTAVLIAGIPVGSYYHEQEIFDVTVWSEPAVRQNLTDIRNLLLYTPSGGQVPLKDVAAVSMQPAPAEIDHDQVSRYVDISAAARGVDLGTLIGRVRTQLQSTPMPLGYHAEVFSDLKARQSANTRSLLYSLAVAAGIFLLLQAAFRSWSRAALLFLTLPLAAAGGLVAALLTDRLLTMGALLGFVVVLSLALRNGMLLIRRLQRLEQREDNALQGTDLVLRAAREEAFPVVTTAVAVGLVLIPFLARGSIVGMEILAPLCVVACGGLVTSTLYTLFILPALYLRLVARTSRTA